MSLFIEYVVFFSLVASGIVFYILDEIWIRKLGVVKEEHGRKPESPIEWRLYNTLIVRGEKVECQYLAVELK